MIQCIKKCLNFRKRVELDSVFYDQPTIIEGEAHNRIQIETDDYMSRQSLTETVEFLKNDVTMVYGSPFTPLDTNIQPVITTQYISIHNYQGAVKPPIEVF